jgi:hypothetical protein
VDKRVVRPKEESDEKKASDSMVYCKLILLFTLIFAVTVQTEQRRKPFVEDSSELESESVSFLKESATSVKVSDHNYQKPHEKSMSNKQIVSVCVSILRSVLLTLIRMWVSRHTEVGEAERSGDTN